MHLKEFIRLLTIFGVLLSSCTTKQGEVSEFLKPDLPIIITPYPPEIGKNIVISYDQNHRNALYKTPQPLYATLYITTQTGGFTRRVLLSSDNRGHFSSQSLKIPDSSVGINISVAPLHVYMTKEQFSTAFADTEQKPVKGGLPYNMRYTSHNFQEAIELFHEDEKLFPDDYERYARLWYGKIKSGMPKQEILHSIDSELIRLQTVSKLSSEQMLGVAACGMGYALLDNPEQATRAIRYLSEHSIPNVSLRFGTVESFEVMLYKLLGFIKKNQDNKEWEELFKATSKFILENNNFNLLAETYNISPNFIIQYQILKCSDTVQDLYRKIARKLITLSNEDEAFEYTGNNPALWSTVASTMAALQEWNDAATLFQIGKRLLTKLPEWVDINNSLSPVSVLPLDRLRVDCANGYIAVASKLNLNQSADSMMSWAWSYPITSSSKGSYSALASSQAIEYLKAQNIDSADKYSALAVNLNAAKAIEVFTQLQKLRTLKGKPTETMAQFKERTKSFAFLLEQIPRMVLQTHEIQGNNSVNIADIKDTITYLFFSSKTCSVCRLFIPRIIPLFASTSLHCRAIIVTDETIEEARRQYGKDASYVMFQPEIQMMFEVGAFPTIFKVKNGIIIQRFDGLSEETTNEIIGQLR